MSTTYFEYNKSSGLIQASVFYEDNCFHKM